MLGMVAVVFTIDHFFIALWRLRVSNPASILHRK